MSSEDEKIKLIKTFIELIDNHPCQNWKDKLKKEYLEELEKLNGKKTNNREF